VVRQLYHEHVILPLTVKSAENKHLVLVHHRSVEGPRGWDCTAYPFSAPLSCFNIELYEIVIPHLLFVHPAEDEQALVVHHATMAISLVWRDARRASNLVPNIGNERVHI
jgi:hypothetical protein